MDSVFPRINIKSFAASCDQDVLVIVNRPQTLVVALDELAQLVHISNLIQTSLAYYIKRQTRIMSRKYLKDGKYSIDDSEVLGSGSFGKVYKGYDHSVGKWVAIKQIDLKILEKYGDQMKEIICNEITVMRKFTKNMKENPCDYLVKHEDCFRTDLFIYIIMQLCDRGTLMEYSKQNKLKQEQIIEIVNQLLTALAYLESMSITHRDLKPQNIFMATNPLDQSKAIVKIGDFGFAAQKQSFNDVMGTYPFMAPEIFQRQQYTSKVDVWALGIIIYEIIFHQLYFIGKAKWDIQKQVKQKQFKISEDKKGRISQNLQEFIRLCLIKDKNMRMKASELLNSPVFLKLIENDSEKLSVFDVIDQEVQYCSTLRHMAELFCVFQEKLQRKTEFIQIYLIKKAYSIMNLITYSIMNKQNYINLQQNHFQELVDQRNNSKYQQLNQKVQSSCIIITEMFNQKYSLFKSYVERFKEEQRSMINLIVTQDPYEKPNQNIVKKELQRWINIIQKQNKNGKWNQLMKYCQLENKK